MERKRRRKAKLQNGKKKLLWEKLSKPEEEQLAY
jgi:hypothetical protein